MKIASEIFDELSDRFDLYSHEREEVESIIAAKLEPVREALRSARLWVSSQIEYTGCVVKDPCETATNKIDSALALLSKGSRDDPRSA